MHLSAYQKIVWFRDHYLSAYSSKRVSVVDLGAQNVNGCLRPVFNFPDWRYLGLDIFPGPNVDCVLKDPYDWSEISPDSVDVLVSVSTLEHIEFFWSTMQQVARVLRPGGLCCLVVPSAGPEHRFPVDCWRFYPDGLRAMAKFAQLEVLGVFLDDDPPDRASQLWKDCVLVCRKPSIGSMSAFTPHHPLLSYGANWAQSVSMRGVTVTQNGGIPRTESIDGVTCRYDDKEERIGAPQLFNHFLDHVFPRLTGDFWLIFYKSGCDLGDVSEQQLSTLDSEHLYVGAPLEGSHTKKPRYAWGIHSNALKRFNLTKAQSMDASRLFIHSSLVRRIGLRFDPALPRHLFMEDFLISAHKGHQIPFSFAPFNLDSISRSRIHNQQFFREFEYFRAKYTGLSLPVAMLATERVCIQPQGVMWLRVSSFSLAGLLGYWLNEYRTRLRSIFG